MAQLEIMFRMVTTANQNDREQYYRRSQVLSHLRHHPHSRHSAPGLCEAGQEWPQQEVFFVTEQDKQGGGYTFEMVRHKCIRVPTLRRQEAVYCDCTVVGSRTASTTSVSQ